MCIQTSLPNEVNAWRRWIDAVFGMWGIQFETRTVLVENLPKGTWVEPESNEPRMIRF